MNAEELLELSAAEQDEFRASMTEEEAEDLEYRWEFWARPKQLPPPKPWRVWMISAGRGFGKTRTGAEWIRALAAGGVYRRFALVAENMDDVHDVLVEGESGILAISPPDFMPDYQPTKRRLIWPNGARAKFYSAEEPGKLRGPQFHAVWADELPKWQRKQQETWDNILFSCRLKASDGSPNAGVVVTTTPNPTATYKQIRDDPQTVTTRGTTYENVANLDETSVADLKRRHEGTRLGRQELLAEDLEDVPGALWNDRLIDANRVEAIPPGVSLDRCGVGVDPSGSSRETAAEAGIIPAVLGSDGVCYVLGDASVHGKPDDWGRAAVGCYHAWDADLIVGEVNFGAEMVDFVVRTVARQMAAEGFPALVNFKAIRASRGKVPRAEPIQALYAAGRVKHVGRLPLLEKQMCEYVPGQKSPDRMDALVWIVSELMYDEIKVVPPLLRIPNPLRGYRG